MGDVRVRQAFNYALDREGLLQALDGGLRHGHHPGLRLDLVGVRREARRPLPLRPREGARRCWRRPATPTGSRSSCPSNNFVPESVFAVYKEQLGAVGINVEWEPTGDDLFGRLLGGSWAAFSFLLQTDPTSWQTIQFSMLPESAWNTSHVADPTVIELAEIVRTGDEAEADAAAKELNAYVVEQAWYAPVYRPVLGIHHRSGHGGDDPVRQRRSLPVEHPPHRVIRKDRARGR